MPTVSDRYDIKSLIERYAQIQVVSDAIVRGVREYHSNCPWCGGHDRFITRPETGQFTCSIRSSGCGRYGDGIDFLVEYMLMSRREAIEELALESVTFADKIAEVSSQNYKEQPPSKKWQETGMVLVELAERALWQSSDGKAMLDYLHHRGLNDETIKKKRFGYVPFGKDGRWFTQSFEAWGLDPDQLTEVQRNKGGVRVPPGIIIPWFESKTLWRIAIKRSGESKGQDYGQITGSGEGMYNIDTIQYEQPAMIVEAELCAASVEQEAGDLINVVATGSTTRGRLGRWIADLSLASFVLQSYDEDEPDERGAKAGDEGATFWLETLKHSLRWSPMLWKDPNDILQAQRDPQTICTLRQWVQYGIDIGRMEFQGVQEAHPLAREIEQREVEALPSIQPEASTLVSNKYQPDIDAQTQFERLCVSDRVETPQGSGTIWDMQQLREHIKRGKIRVSLDALKNTIQDNTYGITELFAPDQLEPLIQVNESF